MKYFALLFLFIAVSELSYASAEQHNALKAAYYDGDAHFIFSGGLSIQKELMGEAGYIYGYSQEGSCAPIGIEGIKMASEFNFNPDRFYIGPKAGATMGIAPLAIGINVIDYTDFHNHDLRLTPEIGLTFFGLVNILYGYNIPLRNETLDFVATHRVTLTVAYDKREWK